MKNIWNLPKITEMPFQEIEEKRPVLLVTSGPAWKAVQERLRLPVVSLLEVTSATLPAWDQILATIRPDSVQAVYAVGGGLTVDAGKYFAAQLGLPLIDLPTALSVDAFLTSASGIRRVGCVEYIETKVADQIIIDFEVIASAPVWLRAAGITDVLSIATGAWDWNYAHEAGRNPQGMAFIPWVYENAQTILNGAIDCSEAAGRGQREGFKTLLDCLCMEVQLCNQIGHARPEEGSEHYFAYAVEQHLGPGLPHGDLVGPGILLMAERQSQPVDRLHRALVNCCIPLDRITPEIVRQTLTGLPEYCQKHQLPYGIAWEIRE